LQPWARAAIDQADQVSKFAVLARAASDRVTAMRQARSSVTELSANVEALRRARDRLRKGVLRLWFATCYGTPILQTPTDRIEADAVDIASRYRAWIEAQGSLPLSVVARDNLAEAVRAIDSEYSWVAAQVVDRFVGFDVHFTDTHLSGDFAHVTSESRRAVSSALATWYQTNRSRLAWDDAEQKFVSDLGTEFERPRVALEVDVQSPKPNEKGNR
jgi:hypothetical protein